MGRERDIEELARLVDRVGAITITGISGIGKTRLAAALAQTLASRFVDGVRLIDLADATTDADVLWLIESALTDNEPSSRAHVDSVVAMLSPRTMLLVLDTCDRSVAAVAELVSRTLQQCPGVRVVATSSAPLGVDGEVVWQLGPLELPDDSDDPRAALSSPAVRLFFDRARAVVPALTSDEQTLQAVIDLCRRVDGIPLAIDLAAGRVATLPVRDLADRLARPLDVLSRRRGLGPTRHRSLRSALDWSCASLDARQQHALAALGCFRGAFTLEAAAAVAFDRMEAEAALDVVQDLVERSFVTVLPGYPTRYRLRDPIREYALDRLRDLPQRGVVLRQHAHFYGAFVQAAATGVVGLDEHAWREKLEHELPNLCAAASWCVETGETELAPLLVSGFQLNFLYARHPGRELCRLATDISRIPGIESSERFPSVLAAAALDTLARRGARASHELSTSALQHARSSDAKQGALPWLVHAWVSWLLGDRAVAIELLEEALELTEGSSFVADRIVVSYGLATYLGAVGDRDSSLRYADEAVRGATALGSPSLLASALVLGALALRDRDPVRALARLEKGVALGAAAGGHIAVAIGEYAIRQIDASRAAGRDLSPLLHAVDNADDDHDAGALAITAQVIAMCVADGYPEEAAMLHGAAPSLGQLGMLDEGRRAFAPRLLDELGTARFEVLLAEGELLGFEGTVALGRKVLGAASIGAEDGTRGTVPTAVAARFVREGDVWAIEHRGEQVRLRDAKGLRYLAHLVGEPFREFHVLDLAGAAGLRADSTHQVTLDDCALSSYRDEIRDLRRERDEAELSGDVGRSERASLELDALVSTLAAAYGVGGRARPFDDRVERCRKAVWKCLRGALQRIGAEAPALARHLENSLRTGTYCSYEPETPTVWIVN